MPDNITAGGNTFSTKELAGAVHVVEQALVDQDGADAMGLVGPAPGANTLLGRLKAIADAVTAQAGLVDGMEGLATTLNGLVDGLEGLLGTTNASLATLVGHVDGLEGFVDGIETLLGTGNASLAAIAGHVDTLEALVGAMSGKLPAALGAQAAAGSLSTVPSTDQDPIYDEANGARVATATGNSTDVITPPPGCKYLRIVATTDCVIRSDGAAAADAAGGIFLPANAQETIPVVAGIEVTARAIAAAGVIYATPMKVR